MHYGDSDGRMQRRADSNAHHNGGSLSQPKKLGNKKCSLANCFGHNYTVTVICSGIIELLQSI